MAEPRATRSPWLRLDGRIGWRGLAGAPQKGFEVGDTLRLGVPGRRAIADTEPFGSFGGRKRVRGLAVDASGRVVIADASGRRLLTWLPPLASGGPSFASDGHAPAPLTTLWPARALRAEERAYDVAAEPALRDEACALATAPHPPSNPYTLVRPTDVAFNSCGEMIVADAGARRVLIVAADLVTLRAVVPVGVEPTALGLDRLSRIYVADSAGARLWRLRPDGRTDHGYRGTAGLEFRPGHVAVEPGGGAFTLGRGRIEAFDVHGRRAPRPLPDALRPAPLEVRDGALVLPDPPREPLRLPGLAAARDGTLAGTALPLLARPRRVARPRTGAFLAGPFDAGKDGFAWDRVTFDLDMPPATRLLVSTLASDTAIEPTRVADAPGWAPELAIAPGETPEVLIQSNGGRHLWLSLTLFGDGAATPEVRAVEIFGPRDSGIAYLPAPFHQDPQARDFVDRFLALFDTQRREAQAVARDFPRFVDPRAVPPGYLDWLGSWFGWEFLADWPEATRREMIAQSVTFFRRRGTVDGLRRMLQWHTGVADPMPAIIEHFRLRDTAEPVWLAGAELTDSAAHAFTVVLPASAVPDADARAQVEAVIAAQAPAHARVSLRLVQPGLRVRDQALIGVDTLLGHAKGEPLGAGRLAQDMSTEPGPGPRLGQTALAREC